MCIHLLFVIKRTVSCIVIRLIVNGYVFLLVCVCVCVELDELHESCYSNLLSLLHSPPPSVTDRLIQSVVFVGYKKWFSEGK